MAGIYQLPRAPETGLSALAQVLLGGAQEYSQNKRADDREARARANRLADVESDRTYARTEGDRTYGRARTDRLADVEDTRAYTKAEQKRAAEAAIRAELILGEFLGAEFIDAPLDSDAVRAAFAAAKKAGLVKNNALVKSAQATGDLTDAAMDTPEGLALGLANHSARLLEQTKQREQSDKDAQVRLDQIATQRDATRSEQSRLSRILGEPDAAIDPRVVSERARAAATANIPKAGFWSGLFGGQQTQPSQKAIDELAPAIQQELVNAARTSADERRREAIVQKGLLADEAQSMGAEANTLTNRTGRSGRSSFTESGTGAGTVLPPPAPPPRTSGTTNLDAARKQFAAGNVRAPTPVAMAPGPAAPPVAPPPTARLSEPAPAPPPAGPSNFERMRNLEPGYNPLTLLTGTTPNRLADIATLNTEAQIERSAPSFTLGEINPRVELQNLERRLSTLPNQNAVEAQTIRNRILQLRQRLGAPAGP